MFEQQPQQPQEILIELSDEQLEQISGGASGPNGAINKASAIFARGSIDFLTLGLGEIIWHSKAGKQAYKDIGG